MKGGLPRVYSLAGAALVALVAACTPLPPAVDSSQYVPLALAPASFTGVRDERANFRALFCREPGGSEEIPDEACRLALRHFRDEGEATRHIEPANLPRDRYRVALALGIGWDCVRDLIDERELPTTALAEAGYATTLLEVEGLSSSERNADIVAAQLEDSLAPEQQLILVGYSKGAVDLMVALQRHPELAARTAALVTVAGSVGGSADGEPEDMDMMGNMDPDVLAQLRAAGIDPFEGMMMDVATP